jgi:hypothetical protein
MNPYSIRILEKPETLEFSPEENKLINSQILDHGKKRDPTFYEENRAAPKNKAISDILIGIKGEFFVARFLEMKYSFPHLLPDLRVLPVGQKGWDADLPYKTIDRYLPNFYVKTCRYDPRFSPSWVYQWQNANGKFGRDALLSTLSYDLYAFVIVRDEWDHKAYISVILPWAKLKPYLREPRLENKVGIKKCIYYADLRRDKAKLLENTAPVA